MPSREPFTRSFFDALSLARNVRDQALIYYQKDGRKAVYEATVERQGEDSFGLLLINGRCVTFADIAKDMRLEGAALHDWVLVKKFAGTAKKIFEHNHIETETGWDITPPAKRQEIHE